MRVCVAAAGTTLHTIYKNVVHETPHHLADVGMIMMQTGMVNQGITSVMNTMEGTLLISIRTIKRKKKNQIQKKMRKNFIVFITSFGASLNIVKSQISLFVAAIKQLNCLPNRMLLPKNTLFKAFEPTENVFAECISNSVSRIAKIKKTYKK